MHMVNIPIKGPIAGIGRLGDGFMCDDDEAEHKFTNAPRLACQGRAFLR